MGINRAKRVAIRIREEISGVLLRRVRDPRIGFVTITDVDVSPDLRQAKIYYSVVGSEVDRDQAAEGLNSARGFIKRELAARLQLKFMPDIEFVYDRSLEYGEKIENLLRDIQRETPEGD
jgi:ribosome-binding factor A